MSSSASVEARLEMNTEKFHKALARLAEISVRGAKQVTIEAARKFAAAAARAMPPSPGKAKIADTRAYRRIIELQPDESNSYLRMSFYHRGIRYRVPFVKTLDHGKFRGVREFSSLPEAQSFSAIKYTGAARYGWLQAVKALGGRVQNPYPARFPHRSSAAHLMQVAGSTVQRESADGGFSVSVENHSRAAGDYWLKKSEAEGRYKAAAALNREIRKIERELKRAEQI